MGLVEQMTAKVFSVGIGVLRGKGAGGLLHSFQCPEKIHGGRSTGGQLCGNTLNRSQTFRKSARFSLCKTRANTVRRSNADRRSPADGQRADGLNNVFDGSARERFNGGRQLALIQQNQDPFNISFPSHRRKRMFRLRFHIQTPRRNLAVEK